jgi:FkbM family methyltransferase
MPMPGQPISYAQFFEDLHLARCFEGQDSGFYIDVGAGHPIHCNVSLLFYLRGWRGITIEPNAWLSQLTAAVRPRDRHIQSLIGAAPGEATYYLVDHLHGLSTTIEDLATAVQREYGKSSQAFSVPMTTLRAVCEQFAPAEIDFLKIDVEGAERAVLEGNDWQRFRPKVIMAEALVPITLAPAWHAWEPILTANGYRYAFADIINRYYVAEEHSALARRLKAAPAAFSQVTQFHTLQKASDNAAHPDHRLARMLGDADMVYLPLTDPGALADRLTAGIRPAELNRSAGPQDIAALHERLFGEPASPGWAESLRLAPGGTVRDLYRQAIATEQFQVACGRISASYAW